MKSAAYSLQPLPRINFLEYLIEHCDVDWTRVVAFHMDEYIGLELNSQSSFSYFLREKLFSKVPVSHFHTIETSTKNIADVCDEYTKLLIEEEIDVVVMGIGENGHIACKLENNVDEYHL